MEVVRATYLPLRRTASARAYRQERRQFYATNRTFLGLTTNGVPRVFTDPTMLPSPCTILPRPSPCVTPPTVSPIDCTALPPRAPRPPRSADAEARASGPARLMEVALAAPRSVRFGDAARLIVAFVARSARSAISGVRGLIVTLLARCSRAGAGAEGLSASWTKRRSFCCAVDCAAVLQSSVMAKPSLGNVFRRILCVP